MLKATQATILSALYTREATPFNCSTSRKWLPIATMTGHPLHYKYDHINFVGSTPRSAILGVSVNNGHLCGPEATTAPMGATTAGTLPELCPPNCPRTCTVASGPSAGQSCVFPWTYDGTTFTGLLGASIFKDKVTWKRHLSLKFWGKSQIIFMM